MKVYGCVHFADNFIRPEKGIGVGLGNFDGLHLGHRHVLERVREQEKNGLYTYHREKKFSQEIYDRLKDAMKAKAVIEK